MTPKLQEKLVQSVLKSQIKKLRFFFNDYKEEIKPPPGFEMQMMVSLESTLCDVGNLLVEKGQMVENLIFII